MRVGHNIDRATGRLDRDYYGADYYDDSEKVNFAKTPVYRYLREAFEHRKIVTFVDIGCGIGNQLESFAGKFPNIVGIDVSVWALKKAKLSLPDLDFVAADVRFLPLKDTSIDAGICISVIEHMSVKDGKKALKEIYRAAKSGTAIVIITPRSDSLLYRSNLCYDPSHVHIYHSHELCDILNSLGFSIKRLSFSSLTPKLKILGGFLKCETVCVVQREP